MQPVIILTSTVCVKPNVSWMFQKNPHERRDSYLKSVFQWLYNTKFKIILVENSGYSFPELYREKNEMYNRFEVITFDEKNTPEAIECIQSSSKGASELFAIQYACDHSRLVNQNPFIIKITARFYIKEFEIYLKNLDLNNLDCLVQHGRYRCEIVGCKFEHVPYIFSPSTYWLVEKIYQSRVKKYNNIHECKQFKIEPTQRGGLNEQYTTI